MQGIRGGRNIKVNSLKVVVTDKSKVTAQYKGNLAIVTEEGNAMIVLQDVRVMENFHRNIVSLSILLSKGCKIMYANYSKIIVVTKGDIMLTFRRQTDDLYYMKVTWMKAEVRDSLVMETSEDHKDDNKEGKSNDIGKVDINVLHEFLNHVGETQIRTTAKVGVGTQPCRKI